MRGGNRLRHGHARKGNLSPEYRSYSAMRTRGTNPNIHDADRYSGRGIAVCDRWLNGEDGKTGFECFLADMGMRPTLGHTLDRKDNDKGYDPTNCRWATKAEQARNARSVLVVEIDGEALPLPDAVDRYGKVNLAAVHRRLGRGMSVIAALTTPNMRPRR